MLQAIRSTRPGGHVGFVGVARGVELPGMELFWSLVHLHGGPAPVRRFPPQLIDLIWDRKIDPARSSTSNSRSTRLPRATRRWTSDVRSRSSFARDQTNDDVARSWAQLTAFFTSALILASSVAVSSFSANEVGHMAPSSRFAVALKPNVAYLSLNFDAGVK
jgi:hypothetical protein